MKKLTKARWKFPLKIGVAIQRIPEIARLVVIDVNLIATTQSWLLKIQMLTTLWCNKLESLLWDSFSSGQLATFIYFLARFVYVHFYFAVVYYIYTQGNKTRNHSQRVSKKIKKVLDKRSRLCYNKDVPRGTKQIATCGIQQEKEVFYE